METELWKQSDGDAKQTFSNGSHHFWVMSYENWVMSCGNWQTKQAHKCQRWLFFFFLTQVAFFFFFKVILRMVNNLLHKFYKLLFINNPKKKNLKAHLLSCLNGTNYIYYHIFWSKICSNFNIFLIEPFNITQGVFGYCLLCWNWKIKCKN